MKKQTDPDYKIFTGNACDTWKPNQPWIVLLHGAQNDHSVWDKQVSVLSESGWNVISPDLPCHGQSGGEPLASVPEMANWIAMLITDFGVRNPVIAGHSMGSLIAIELAMKHQLNCQKLILLGTALPMPVSSQLLAMTRDNPLEAIRLICKWSHNPAKTPSGIATSSEITAASLQLMERVHHENSALTLFSDMNACNAYQPDFESLKQISVPVHIIAGEADKMTPLSAAKKASGYFKNSHLHVIPNAGHSLMTESGEETVQLLSAILNGGI